MAHSVQVLVNKYTIDFVPVSHVKVRNGGGSEGQKITSAGLPLRKIIFSEKWRVAEVIGSVQLYSRIW